MMGMGAGESATPERAGAAPAAGNYTYAVHPLAHPYKLHPPWVEARAGYARPDQIEIADEMLNKHAVYVQG